MIGGEFVLITLLYLIVGLFLSMFLGADVAQDYKVFENKFLYRMFIFSWIFLWLPYVLFGALMCMVEMAKNI